jgi:hypothetical protein
MKRASWRKRIPSPLEVVETARSACGDRLATIIDPSARHPKADARRADHSSRPSWTNKTRIDGKMTEAGSAKKS